MSTKATKKPTAGGGASSDRKGTPLKDAASSSSAAAVVPTGTVSTGAVPMKDSDGKDTRDVRDPRKEAALSPSTPSTPSTKAPSAVQALALELIATNDAQAVLRHAIALEDEREATANQAARLVQELAESKPELLVPLIERFGRLVVSKNRRVVASAAGALAPLSRIAPAKVAKQLPVLTQNWESTTDEGKDGLVRTFAGLCTASVAYQKRLEPALARALGEAEPKLLIRWTEIVLPALKGEPHARARAVVEERLPNIPRPQAQKIADFLGIKLRPVMR